MAKLSVSCRRRLHGHCYSVSCTCSCHGPLAAEATPRTIKSASKKKVQEAKSPIPTEEERARIRAMYPEERSSYFPPQVRKQK